MLQGKPFQYCIKVGNVLTRNDDEYKKKQLHNVNIFCFSLKQWSLNKNKSLHCLEIEDFNMSLEIIS